MKGKKTGGRQKGSLNKVSEELRIDITQFLADNFIEVIKIWQKTESNKDKLSFYKDLLKYAVPTLQSTELDFNFDKLTDEQLDYIIDNLIKKNNE